MHKNGISLNSVEKSLSHSADKIRRRTLLCFEKFLVSKSCKQSRGAGHHGFVESFCLTGPKRKALWRNPSVFRKFSGIEKNLWIRWGLSRFSVEIFMSHSVENFRKGILLFLRKYMVSQCRKTSWASLQCFRKFGVSKNFMPNRGYHNFPSKIFCLTVPKNFV